MNEQKLDLILTEVQKVNERVSELSEKVTVIDERVTELTGKVTVMDERVTELTGKVTVMDERVTELTGKVTVMDERVTELTGRVTNIETEQQRQGEHIQQLIQIVGVTNQNLIEFRKETTKRFNWVDRHLRLLESDFDLILLKSNEHERDINRLKHVE